MQHKKEIPPTILEAFKANHLINERDDGYFLIVRYIFIFPGYELADYYKPYGYTTPKPYNTVHKTV